MSIARRSAPCLLTWSLCLLTALSADAVEPGYRVCLDQYPLRPLERVVFATDAGAARLDALTAERYLTAAALEAGSTWDFSPATGPVAVYQQVPVAPAWSCSVGGGCAGFGPGRARVLRTRDALATGARQVWALDSDGASRLLLQGVVSDEATPDESRLCFDTGVTLLDYATSGACLAGGETWSTVLTCGGGSTDGDACGAAQPQLRLDSDLEGRTVRAGTLTLPSGHVVDSVLTEALLALDARLPTAGGCGPTVGSLQLSLLQWTIPHYGPMVEILGPDDAADLDWQTAGGASIGFGLLPPLSARIDAVGPDSVTVSWDAGRDPRFVEEYVVHWGMAPGAMTPPPFSSELRGDVIPAGQTTYVVSGLSPGTRYYVSVTTKGSYIDPVSGVTTLYRSIELPAAIGADVDGDGRRDTSYPPEVSAATTPSQPVSLLRDWLREIDPPSPPVASVLPLGPSDVYRVGFVSGGEDDEPGVLDDLGRRLVFYALDLPAAIRLTRTPARTIRIDY